jgi:hypothetical protein
MNTSDSLSLTNRRPSCRLLAIAATLTVVSSVSAPARADNLDAALLKNAPEVVKYLKEHHCKNVGVLKFRVHKAGHPNSFTVGSINDNLPGRLEYALIASMPSDAPVGIIRDASGVAATSKVPRYDNPTGQRALFARKYPLSWGSSTVTPDLMLTGVISVRADLKTASVLIEAFGPESDRQDKVLAFKVNTDRSLLTDLNESFQIKSRQLKARGKKRSIDLDEDSVADAAEDNTDSQSSKKSDSTSGSTSTASVDAQASADNLLDYEIRYDGQPQAVTTDPNSPGEFHVAEPNENQVVTIGLKSKSSERFGVALLFNGKSTLYEEEGDPNHLKAWVMEPGASNEIRGFQMDNNTLKPFRVLSDADSAAMAYGPNTGMIQFHIYREGSGGGLNITSKDSDSSDAASKAMNISLRGLNRATLVRSGHARSLGDLKKAIREYAHVGPKGRGLIVDGNITDGKIRNDEIKNQVLVQSIAVRYYKPKSQ